MSCESRKQPDPSSLSRCLVEGDGEQRRRERSVRRRALIVSVLVEAAALTVLVLVPLLGRPERIAAKEFVPIPPYGPPRHRVQGSRTHPSGDPGIRSDPFFAFHPNAGRPHRPSTGEANREESTDIDSLRGDSTTGPPCSWCVPGDKSTGPRPPEPSEPTPAQPRIVRLPQLDPAMLIHRVEPVYPPLAKQIHKEGRVELRAIISTDGSIQSLEMVGGDPLFYRSAREAVLEWRYKPTLLNGQPVEIDTYITVIYILQR